MILGVAQIVANVHDLSFSVQALCATGWQVTFRDELANHPAKTPLQSRVRTRMSLVHLNPPAPIPAIELTSYVGEQSSARAAFEAAVPGLPRGAVPGVSPAERTMSVRLPAAEPEASLAWWCEGLSFWPTRARADEQELEFRALLPSWRLSLVIARCSPDASSATVDACGVVLVTMVSTDIEADLARVGRTSGSSVCTGPWEEDVGGRRLRVAMVRGPSGEIVELLQTPKIARST